MLIKLMSGYSMTKLWGNGDPLRYQTLLSDSTFTFHFHALEKEMATHSSVLARRILGMGEPVRLPSMRSYRIGHDWSDAATAAYMYHLLWNVYISAKGQLFYKSHKWNFTMCRVFLFQEAGDWLLSPNYFQGSFMP